MLMANRVRGEVFMEGNRFVAYVYRIIDAYHTVPLLFTYHCNEARAEAAKEAAIAQASR